MEVREINLNEWEKAGEGATAVSYFHKTDSSIMLKLFTGSNTDSGYAFREYEFSKNVESCGVKTPKAIEVVKANGQLGVVYQRIQQKVSFSKLCHDNPDKIGEYAAEFAKELKLLHSLKCKESGFTPIKEIVTRCISSSKVYHFISKRKLFSFMEEVGDDDVYLHGDPHSGNLIKAGNENYWIDLGAFTHGSPWYDLGCVFFFYKLGIGRMLSRKLLHMNGKQLTQFYKEFVYTYTGSRDKKDYKMFNKKVRRACLLFSIYTIDVEHYKGLANLLASIVIRDLALRW